MQLVLQTREKELEDLTAGIDRIRELYIDMEIAKQQYKERKERQEDLIRRAKEEAHQVKESLGFFNGLSNNERLKRIDELKAVWHNLDVTSEEKNRLAKQIIDRITYVRLKQDAEIKVDFL